MRIDLKYRVSIGQSLLVLELAISAVHTGNQKNIVQCRILANHLWYSYQNQGYISAIIILYGMSGFEYFKICYDTCDNILVLFNI